LSTDVPEFKLWRMPTSLCIALLSSPPMTDDHAALLHDLEKQGWALADHLLPAGLATQLGLASRLAWRKGLFKPAHIGTPGQPLRAPGIRGDTIHWLEQDSIAPGWAAFQSWAADLQQQLNRYFFIGLRRAEFHFARYDRGHGYRKHMDQHRGQPHRRISLVLYLNRHWTDTDGGQLCLYAPSDPSQEIIRIQPRFGRIVIFRSDLIPHAVLPANRQRWSLTGWFRSDDALLGSYPVTAASNDSPFPGSTPSGAAA